MVDGSKRIEPPRLLKREHAEVTDGTARGVHYLGGPIKLHEYDEALSLVKTK